MTNQQPTMSLLGSVLDHFDNLIHHLQVAHDNDKKSPDDSCEPDKGHGTLQDDNTPPEAMTDKQDDESKLCDDENTLSTDVNDPNDVAAADPSGRQAYLAATKLAILEPRREFLFIYWQYLYFHQMEDVAPVSAPAAAPATIAAAPPSAPALPSSSSASSVASAASTVASTTTSSSSASTASPSSTKATKTPKKPRKNEKIRRAEVTRALKDLIAESIKLDLEEPAPWKATKRGRA